ncbi:hypothetical protein P3X46_014731 [Hevea brasiliensis]|uniref:Short-chain dehydrogenase/reductase n=1 Tax=Hevea brasiliensis TaxID=3981 RepID=A0ABQ9LTL1_HEVBR|nr:hypothetical protein P3X46_014731 [Hevea brasiliensis]
MAQISTVESKVSSNIVFDDNAKQPRTMAVEREPGEISKRYAVVTGANKGIGFEICRQLALNVIVVVLTARDEKRGLEALGKLKHSGLSDLPVFHQLDVANVASIAALANFVRTQIGKLDILVNNAGVPGVRADADVLRAKSRKAKLTEECLAINYYGAKRMVEALVPLLQLSDSPRIVNVSSSLGKLKNISNEWTTEVLGDADNLSEERIDEVLSKYLEDFKEGSLESKGWPAFESAYILSKAAMNAYTRILAKKLPTFRIKCVCPGYVKTDINMNRGILSVEEGAESPVTLAPLPNDGPSG